MGPTRSGAAVLLAIAGLTGIAALTPSAQQAPPAAYSILAREGRRSLAVRSLNGQEMFALDDLAKLFDMNVREDALAGGLTISTKTQTIALTAGQPLASVGGRVVSLPAPPQREGRAWFVPLDFVPRVIGPALGNKLDLRRGARLIVVGDLRVPRVSARAEQAGPGVRVTYDVTPATPHSVAQDGNRLVIKFDADALDTSLPASPAADLVQAIRLSETGAAVVMDLGSRSSTYRAADAPGDRGAGRIVIDVLPQLTETAAPAAPAPAAPPADPPPVLDLKPAGGLRTIVIDAGHGGDEHGARGPGGKIEKDVTLSVARKVKAAIETRLGARVILTRDGDQTIGLDERAAVANNNKADLFISLHVNASVRRTVSGAEVFYLSVEDYGDEMRRAAQGDREVLPVLGGGTRDIEVIPWELSQARHIDHSTALATIVEAELRQRVPMSPRAIQQAPFRVLVGANMPAVLVEMGFISNPEQERQLASDAFQTQVVQALVESVVRFRERAAAPAAVPIPAARQ